MSIKSILSVFFLAISVCTYSQSNSLSNQTDSQGRKQGKWVKNYPDGTIMYEGVFRDDHPVGELKRYYENSTIKSILNYSNDGRTAIAKIYHPNGYISAKGTYVDQKKEGVWQFFSTYLNGYKVSEESYKNNLKNGPSLKFYTDSAVAEKLHYTNDVKSGEWTQYYPTGKIHLKSFFHNGKLNGKFEVWYENGAIEYSGQYKNDSREGEWLIFKSDGTIKYKLNYVMGFTQNKQMEIDESNFIDSLENNIGKISDPEKTGINRQ